MAGGTPSTICSTCKQPYSARNSESHGCEEHTEARIELGIDVEVEEEWSAAEAGAAVADALDQLDQEPGPWHISGNFFDRIRRLEDSDGFDD